MSNQPEESGLIEVLSVEPGQYPKIEKIRSGLKSMQKAVGGYIEAVYPYDDPVALICDEEAKLKRKPPNRALRDDEGRIYDKFADALIVVIVGINTKNNHRLAFHTKLPK